MTERTIYTLARMAECYDPDSLTSPGGRWLQIVESAASDLADYDDQEDGMHEVADSLVPIYAAEVWAVFVDLGAYQQDVDDYGPITDMEKGAQIALYMIAETLLRAVLEDDAETTDDDDDD